MKRLKKRIIIETLCLAGVLGLFFLLCQKNFVALGVLVGAFTGIACFQLLAKHIFASTSIGLHKIKPYFFLQYLIRYAIMGAALFFCAKIGLRLFIGAACGLLLIPIGCLSFALRDRTCKIQAK